MTSNFLKKIKEGKVDQATHYKFTRFGMGDFQREELNIKKGSNVELKAGFDFADTFVRFLAKHAKGDIAVKGVIVSSNKNLESSLKKLGFSKVSSRGKKYTVEGTLQPEQLQKAMDELLGNIVLLSASGKDMSVKSKPSPPKPGSLKEKLCTLKVPGSMWDEIKEEFLFFTDEKGKNYSVHYSYHISDIIVDDNLIKSDPARARKEAKRKGTIKCKVSVDKGEPQEVELSFEA